MSSEHIITNQAGKFGVKRELLERLLKEEGAHFNSFPLSYAQERLWFLDQLMPNSRLYNMPLAVRFTGRLDAAALEKGFRRIVRRHEALRTIFMSIDGRPVQFVSPDCDWTMRAIDLCHFDDSEREEEARRLAREEAEQPFDLARGPLMRATLLRLGDQDHVLLLTMHHIVSDGWSVGLLFRELKAHLDSILCGEPSTLDDLPIQYADYAMWQRDWLRGEVLEEQLAYWKKQLGGVLPALELPADRPRPAAQSFRGAERALVLPANLSDALKALSRREGVTLFVTMLAAFKALLYCYTEQRDIIVASSVANRDRAEVENLIGLFINIIALRTDLSGDPSFRELLKRVREVTLGAYAHQDLPFEKLIAEVQPERVASYAPLTQVGFTLRNAPVDDLKFTGLALSPFKATGATTAKTDLMLYVVERPDAITGTVEYSTDLFEASTIDRMIERYQSLLEAAVRDPQLRLSALRSLTGQAQPRTRQAARQREGSNLTRSQMLYWAGQKLRPDASLFNVINAFVISRNIDAAHFQNAFQTLVNSSDALRTVICESGGAPVQKVLPRLDYRVEIVDLAREPDPEAELDRWLGHRREVVFNLQERLFEAALVKLADEKFALYVNHHQLISDAWSTFLIYERLSQFYGLALKGELEAVVALPQFQDYVEHEREYRRSPRFAKVEAYWKAKLADPVEPIAFYGKAPEQQTTRGARVPCQLGRARIEKLRELATRKGIFVATVDLSLFNIFAALLFVYLHSISGNRKLSIRVMHHNRLTKEFAETIGMFMEMLPLRITFEEGETFGSLIRKVSAEVLETLKQGQHTIVNQAQDKTPSVALNYIHAPFPTFDGSPVTINWVHPGYQNEILDLQVRKVDSSGDLILEFDFDSDAFSDEQQARAVEHFLRMLDALLEDIDCPIDRADFFLPEAQRQRIASLEGEAEFDFD